MAMIWSILGLHGIAWLVLINATIAEYSHIIYTMGDIDNYWKHVEWVASQHCYAEAHNYSFEFKVYKSNLERTGSIFGIQYVKDQQLKKPRLINKKMAKISFNSTLVYLDSDCFVTDATRSVEAIQSLFASRYPNTLVQSAPLLNPTRSAARVGFFSPDAYMNTTMLCLWGFSSRLPYLFQS